MTQSISPLYLKKLDPRAVLPMRGTALSAGLDLFCIEEIQIEPNGRARARTGLSAAIPYGFYGRLAPRSGLAVAKGIDVLAGVIDADYRGEIICLLYNTAAESVVLSAGTKVCQLIIEQIITPEAAWAEELEETQRGASGFGSTGL
ncbi:MAG: dUTP diphosphatase [Acidobacteriota bacterium]